MRTGWSELISITGIPFAYVKNKIWLEKFLENNEFAKGFLEIKIAINNLSLEYNVRTNEGNLQATFEKRDSAEKYQKDLFKNGQAYIEQDSDYIPKSKLKIVH